MNSPPFEHGLNLVNHFKKNKLEVKTGIFKDWGKDHTAASSAHYGESPRGHVGRAPEASCQQPRERGILEADFFHLSEAPR